MFSISKEWNEWNVDLQDLHIWLQANGGAYYSGMSADYSLTLWWTEDPGSEIVAAVESRWSGLTEEGEAAKIAARLSKDEAVKDAFEALPSLDWDDMTTAERKLVLNRSLSEDDRAALLIKYPQ